MNFMFEWQEQYCSCHENMKIHIIELTCNSLFIIWAININGRDRKAALIQMLGINTNEKKA